MTDSTNEKETAPRFRTAAEESDGRTVVAVSWLDRARVRMRRQHMPAFRSEVTTPTALNDIAGLAEQASRDLYKPTMDATGRHMRTIQEDLAEHAAEGGVGIGQGKHSYEAPMKNIKELDGLRFTGLDEIPLMGKLFQLIRSNPKAARVVATPQAIERGTFFVEVERTVPPQYHGPYDATTGRPQFPDKSNTQFWTPEQKVKRDVDIVDVQNPGALQGDEMRSIDRFTASLLRGENGAQMSPQQILKLHDQLQSGQTTNLKAGPNASQWVERVMGGAGEALKTDAARVGWLNFAATLVKGGLATVAAIGAASALGAMGAGMAHISPPNEKAAPAIPNNPYAPPTTTDPAAAFGAQQQGTGMAPPQQQASPATYQPFGAVNQNFGNLPASAPAQGGGIGAMPTAPSAPNVNAPDPYGWTRVNAAAGRVLQAQNAQMAPGYGYAPQRSEGGAAFEAVSAALHGTPSEEQIGEAFNGALSLGDTPQGHEQMLKLMASLAAFAPQIERFNAMANGGNEQAAYAAPQQPQQSQAAYPQQPQVMASSGRERRFAGRSDGSLSQSAGFDLLDNQFTGSAAFLNSYFANYNAMLERARTDPQFAAWLRQNPEALQGVNPETMSYYGGGAENAQTYRQTDPNENWEQELERDLQTMNSGQYQQWEAAQQGVQNQIAQNYGNAGLTDAYGNSVGPALQNTYNTVNPQGAQAAPQYNAWAAQPQGNPNVGPLPQHNNWAQGQQPQQYSPPQPSQSQTTYRWMPGPNGGGNWVPNR
jgi:hypothetical protein